MSVGMGGTRGGQGLSPRAGMGPWGFALRRDRLQPNLMRQRRDAWGPGGSSRSAVLCSFAQHGQSTWLFARRVWLCPCPLGGHGSVRVCACHPPLACSAGGTAAVTFTGWRRQQQPCGYEPTGI